MTDRELMQQALEALIASGLSAHATKKAREAAVTTLRKRLAQPEQEPFGYFQYSMHLDAWVQNKEGIGIAFYTAPPQRKPLTDEEIIKCVAEVDDAQLAGPITALIRAVERKLCIGEKE